MRTTKPLIAVTGKSGQLGWELMRLSGYLPEFQYYFTGRNEVDLARPETIHPFFERYQPAVFINCAAYTAVDKAETEKDLAYLVNATAVEEIARCCKLYNCILISISTDYVFNGEANEPYRINHVANPVNHYGFTKLRGEQLILEQLPSAVIIRTSWVYSEHGNNFVKTMLRLMAERPELKIVNDQQGCPTYAADLAKVIMQIVQQKLAGHTGAGIYHYSNQGITTWFHFAEAICKLAGLACKLEPIPSSAYPTPAKRPGYSVLDTSKIVDDFGITPRNWEESLQECISKLQKS